LGKIGKGRTGLIIGRKWQRELPIMMMHRFASKMLFLTLLILGFFHGSAWAQNPVERTFELGTESEVLLDLTAAAPGTSWSEKGKEAAVARILVDGRYQQDVILFAGSHPFTYSLMLGHLAPGTHSLRIEHNRKQSAADATSLEIKEAKISAVDRSSAEYQALSLAPILYARPNTIGRFSDVPLIMWYELERSPSITTLRYSVILTNEDGGTQTNALMARWGRTTDIEWIYEVQINAQGQPVSGIFQGKDHRNRPFRGKRESGHPIFMVATDNNMVSDHGQSQMRFALRPIPFDLSRASREEVMFRHPWIYQIMAAELQREGKINESSRVGQQIGDPRHYLYIEAGSEQQGTALSFAVKLKGDRKWYTSNLGLNYFKVDRSGYFQTTVRLPAGTTIDRIEKLAVRCDLAQDPRSREAMIKAASAGCELKTINRIFMLDDSYQPGPALPFQAQPLKLQFGDMIELYDGRE
jgi:hypothetical protein